MGVYPSKSIWGLSMADHEIMNPGTSAPIPVSRRDLIKGVIAAGAVSSASYLFRASTVWAQASAPGAVERLVTLTVNGQQRDQPFHRARDPADDPALQTGSDRH